MTAYNANVLPSTDSESGNNSNNNIFQGAAEKTVSNDNFSNGFGIARPASLKPGMETFPGSEASEQSKLKMREIARFDNLQSSGAMSMTAPITSAGIVLSGFADTGYGEGGTKPDIQGGANK